VILVDTSAWIDFLRAYDTPVAQVLADLVEAGASLAITEPVIMELLAGADTLLRRDALERLTTGLPLLGVDPHLDFRTAAGILVEARREGRTIRSLIECLIASVAIRNDVELLHKDADYDVMTNMGLVRSYRVT